jgi:hypothetical protein
MMPSSRTRFQDASSSTRLNQLVAVPRKPPTSTAQSRSLSPLYSLPKEPEDARLTGGTRSLDRRLLALNIAGSLTKGRPVARYTPDPSRSAVA